MPKYQRFEDLPAWQEAARLYNHVLDLLKQARLGLSPGYRNQLDRAALSVSNNIAEGFDRVTTGELLSFLAIARGSAGEVKSMISVIISRDDVATSRGELEHIRSGAESCARQLTGWIMAVETSPNAGRRHIHGPEREVRVAQECRQGIEVYGWVCGLGGRFCPIMHGRDLAQPLGGLLRSQVSLRLGQQLVADHKLLDRGGTQKRRIKVGVQLPMIGIGRVERSAMPAHRIRKRGEKQVVVADQAALENLRQAYPFFGGQLRQPLYRAPREEQEFKGPDGPIRHQHNPMGVGLDDARLALEFLIEVIEQEAPFPELKVLLLAGVFLFGHARQPVAGPDLAMGMRIRAAHGGAFVFKDLDPTIVGSQLARLAGPEVNHFADLG